MINKILQPTIISASLEDYPTIQNMARFYLYDMSRYCAVVSNEWNIPKDGLYECFDFKNYFTDPTRKAFLVKVGEALAGFVLLDKEGKLKGTDWNMGEFFILAQFQGKGVSELVAYEIWKTHPGSWEVSIIPENMKALCFWRNVIGDFTNGHYIEEIKKVDFDEHQPNRYILTFDTKPHAPSSKELKIRQSTRQDIESIILLSYQKRRFYEKAQPQFWKYAGPEAEITQAKWFEELLTDDGYIMLTALNKDKVVGFVIGRLIPSPEVYNPGGLTLMIDDFCVEQEKDWTSLGTKLVDEIKLLAQTKKGAAQILIVCGAHDRTKRHFLKNMGLTIASEWYVDGVS